MQVTNEIRHAWLYALLGRENRNSAAAPHTVESYLTIAFEATETEELMKWLTLQEKVAFGKKLLALCPNLAEPQLHDPRDLQSDLTEDRW